MPEALSVLIQSLLSTLYSSEKELLQTRLYKNISDVHRKERYHKLRKQSLKMPTTPSLQARIWYHIPV